MAKKVKSMIKLQVPAAKATPAPPIGPALGQHGVNIPGFCKEFNERTAKEAGMIIPVVITVYTDNTFTFITKTPPVPVLIKKELNLQTASGPSLSRRFPHRPGTRHMVDPDRVELPTHCPSSSRSTD